MLISTGYVTLPASNHHGRQVPKQLRFSARQPRTRRRKTNKNVAKKHNPYGSKYLLRKYLGYDLGG